MNQLFILIIFCLLSSVWSITSWLTLNLTNRYGWPRNYIFEDSFTVNPLPTPWWFRNIGFTKRSSALNTPLWSNSGDGKTSITPFDSSISTVRLLSANADGSDDFVRIGNQNTLIYNFTNIDIGFDNMIAHNIEPFVVLDNVCLDFVSPARRKTATYGNPMGPDDDKVVLWSTAIGGLIDHLIDRYGSTVVNSWQFRIATEPECPCHWLDTIEKYNAMYKAVANVVRSKLSTARIHVGNFAYAHDKGKAQVQSFIAAASKENWPLDVIPHSMYILIGESMRSHIEKKMSVVDAALAASTRSSGFNPNKLQHEVQEFALWSPGNGQSSPTGAFAGAWYAAWVRHSLDARLTRTFHWSVMDNGPGISLLTGQAWVISMLRLMESGIYIPLTSTTHTFPRYVTGFATIHHPDYKTRTAVNDFENQRLSPERVTIAVPTLVEDDPSDKTERTVSIVLPLSELPESLRPEQSLEQSWEILEFKLDESTSAHDQLHKDLKQRGLLDASAPTTHALGWRQMATSAAAIQFVKDSQQTLQTKWLSTLEPRPFTDGTAVWYKGAGNVRVSFNATFGSTRWFVVQKKLPPTTTTKATTTTTPKPTTTTAKVTTKPKTTTKQTTTKQQVTNKGETTTRTTAKTTGDQVTTKKQTPVSNGMTDETSSSVIDPATSSPFSPESTSHSPNTLITLTQTTPMITEGPTIISFATILHVNWIVLFFTLFFQ